MEKNVFSYLPLVNPTDEDIIFILEFMMGNEIIEKESKLRRRMSFHVCCQNKK